MEYSVIIFVCGVIVLRGKYVILVVSFFFKIMMMFKIVYYIKFKYM